LACGDIAKTIDSGSLLTYGEDLGRMGCALDRQATAHLAFYLHNLEGGGVQKMTLNLVRSLIERGYKVDLVLCKMKGPLCYQIPDGVKVVVLKRTFRWLARLYALAADPAGIKDLLRPILLCSKPSTTLHYLPDLVRYLRRERPVVLFTALPYLNLVAIWARRLAAVPSRVVISERNRLSKRIESSQKARWKHLPPLIHRTYHSAAAIVAVSEGVAEDLALYAGISRTRITTIYNPVVTLELLDKARAPLNHPWFEPGMPPVVLGMGRLTRQKDFPTLIRAFVRVRRKRPGRLMILGQAIVPSKEAQSRQGLTALAAELGVLEDLALPGFVENPFSYFTRAAVFALSSAWEGFGNVLAEALACGCPVVSTDCPSGPAEILDYGAYGALVPVGNDEALAQAIIATLNCQPDPAFLRARGAMFSVDHAVKKYLDVALGVP
jgi:glycosyltransferase involved in cell wall biosynthesis